MNVDEAFKIFNENADASDYIIISREKGISGCIEYIQQITGCEANIAKQIIEQHDSFNPLNFDISPAQIAYNNAVAKEWQNKPKCPTCGSQNIEKISLTKKAFGGAIFGLFSSNVRNTMYCKNCGYKW